MSKYFLRLLQSGSIVFIVLISAQMQACADESNNTTYSQLDSFWNAFRKSALSGDKETMVQLTQFPLAIRGEMDDDPVIYLNQSAFNKKIDSILAQNTGLSEKPETILDLIKRTTKVKDEGGGTIRVGNLLFNSVKGNWLLVRAYIYE